LAQHRKFTVREVGARLKGLPDCSATNAKGSPIGEQPAKAPARSQISVASSAATGLPHGHTLTR